MSRGSGVPVVLVHGRLDELEMWSSSGILDALSKDYRVVAVDLRGHGESDKPRDPAGYGRNMGLDIIRLLDQHRISRAHVVGYSLGGNIVSQLLTTHEARFLSATLIAGPGRFNWTSEEAARRETQARNAETQKECRSTGGRTLDCHSVAAVIRSFGDQVITPEQVAAVRVPTLAVVGTDDPIRESVEQFVRIRPSAQLLLVQGATHDGNRGVISRPELLTALRGFLRAH